MKINFEENKSNSQKLTISIQSYKIYILSVQTFKLVSLILFIYNWIFGFVL